ncbi:PT domain-containing protein [Streptomyces sp. AVP053U2]|uniref:PT domain-containing protein n=1 Tax=Streptomyces sp. AVP053U2 TaxID=1737066 RepID=UPI000D1B39C9
MTAGRRRRHRLRYGSADRPTDRPTARPPDRPTARPTDRPTARPPDRPCRPWSPGPRTGAATAAVQGDLVGLRKEEGPRHVVRPRLDRGGAGRGRRAGCGGQERQRPGSRPRQSTGQVCTGALRCM